MTDEQLVFNGIDGATGAYGLAPMTAEALSAHIGQMHDYGQEERRERQREREQLARMLQGENTERVAAIVRLLAESCLEDAPRDDAWQRAWLGRLAAVTAGLLPGEEYDTPEKRREIEDKLRVDPVNKIVQVVALLAGRGGGRTDQARELEALLLRDPALVPDYDDGLRAQLDHDFRNRLEDVRRSARDAVHDPELEHDAAAQRAWLDAFCRDLHTLPIDAWNARQGLGGNTIRAAWLLAQTLEGPAGAELAGEPHVEEMRRDLVDPAGRLAWHDLVDSVQRRLDALLVEGGDPSPWSQLVGLLRRWLLAIFQKTPFNIRGVVEGVDRTRIDEAGWGIIFPWEDAQSPGSMSVGEIKEALEPLLRLRQSSAGERFRIYEKGQGYRPGETAQEFLERHGASVHNPADPEKVPYYLLIVGSPQQIPFHVQYQLDVQYAVGRLDLERLDDFANYARSVVAAEGGDPPAAPRAVFFGVSNPDDRATELSAGHLVKPLYEQVGRRFGDRWQVEAVLGDGARKARLQRLLGGEETPALLFAACHGMEFDKDDPRGRQARHQGALLCGDWGGPSAEQGEIPAGYYLSGDDLGDDADLQGLIGFFFACYSAGTPLYDQYGEQAFRESGRTLARQPFVAALPKAMLSRPRGGALAIVGHVERAWGTSFLGARQREQIAHFQSAIEHLLKGQPIGSAMEYFNGRYAAMSTELTYALQPTFGRQRPDAYEMAALWTANNDARGYIVLGDPAVRLPSA